jgi:hypothetical protein
VKDHQEENGPPAEPRPPFDPRTEAPLLSAYVDGELEPEEKARVEAHLATSPDSQAEVARLRQLREVTEAMILREAPAEEWEIFWLNIYNRVERGLGWLVLTLGAVVVAGYSLYQFVLSLTEAPDLPWYLKGGIFAVCLGVLVLLVSVIRERIFVRRRTRYKDVIR